jgi:hypothetical protein
MQFSGFTLLYLGFLAVCILLLGYTGRDDSHITYFVSQHWADTGQYANYNGDRLEQSTTLLYALILGIFSWLSGVDAATMGPITSFAFLLIGYVVAAIFLNVTGLNKSALLAFFSIPMLYWSLSGMENSLYLLLLLTLCLTFFLAFDAGDQNNAHSFWTFVVSLLSCALTLTRPEFIFVIILAIFLFVIWGAAGFRLRFVSIIPILSGVALAILLRLTAGFDLFPNTVYAKQSDINLLNDIEDGLSYLISTALLSPVSSLLAFFGFLWAMWTVISGKMSEDRKYIIKFLLCLTFALSMFPIVSGGDWMEAGRFLAVPILLGSFSGFATLRRNVGITLSLVLVAGLLLDTFRAASQNWGGIPYFRSYNYSTENYTPSPLEAHNVIHARDLSFIDQALPALQNASDTSGRVVVASIQAGMVPYYLRKSLGEDFYFVDLFGLSTDHVIHCRGAIGWGYDPYANIRSLEQCTGEKFDFVYDLDRHGWPRLERLLSIGCREVFREELMIGPFAPWKGVLTTRQFLADCRY